MERELRALRVEWPATPDLAAAVEVRVGEAPTRRGRAMRSRSGRAPAPRRGAVLAGVAAALLILVAAGLAASPAARSALLDLLGLRGARVQRSEPPPRPAPRPGTLGSGLRLGRPATLAEASARVDFGLLAPASLGVPDAVWLDAAPNRPVRVSLVYRRRPAIPPAPATNVAVLLTEFRAAVTPVLQKAIGADARLRRLAVNGARAYLITGEPHGFAWVGPNGQIAFEDRRLAGRTLLVERDDGVLLRAEGRLPLARAGALARELAAR
jgi:hypothetical protein